MLEINPDTHHVVALSGGKDSTALALRLHELHPDIPFEWVCTPTGDELPDMVDHWAALRERLGHLKIITNGVSLQGLIRRWNAVPNARMRWCTRVLKLEPFIDYVTKRRPVVIYVGLRADEPTREGAVYGDLEGVEQRFPLREWGWGISDVVNYLMEQDIKVPSRTDCARCYAQTLGEWWNLWRFHPDVMDDAIADEERTGRHFRSASSWQAENWPVWLKDLKAEFERGRVPARSKTCAYQGTLFDDMGFSRGKCRVCSL